MAFNSLPIMPVSTISGNQWLATRIIEESGQTFLSGTPVSIASGDGGLQAWDGFTISSAQGAICGIAYEAASNLATTGKGAPTPGSPLTGIGATLTFGSVPNESSAVNIPHGAPINDGRCGVVLANNDNIFSAPFASNGIATQPAATDVGVAYGMTKGANNYWYVDKNKTGASAVVMVVALDLRDVPAAGTRVLFQFLAGAVNLIVG